MAKNTIITKWVNPKGSSVEIVFRKKAINDYNVEGKQIKWVRFGEVKYIDWNQYQMDVAMDTSLPESTRMAAYKKINKGIRDIIERDNG